jgi:hypothetical protein
VYSKRFENPENLFGVYIPQSADYRIYIFFPSPANREAVHEFCPQGKQKDKKIENRNVSTRKRC